MSSSSRFATSNLHSWNYSWVNFVCLANEMRQCFRSETTSSRHSVCSGDIERRGMGRRRWRISRVSRRHLMSQRIDRGAHHSATITIFPMACLPKLRADVYSPSPEPLRKASDWNAASVRSFVTYDALMKFADPRATVSQSCPDERRNSSCRRIMEWLHHCSVGSTVVRGNELTFNEGLNANYRVAENENNETRLINKELFE